MSWFLGTLGPCAPDEWRDGIERVTPSSQRARIHTRDVYVQAGGLDETCWHYSQNRSEYLRWVVVGTAVRPTDRGYEVVTHEEWHDRMSGDILNLDQLGGHFAGLRVGLEDTTAFVDTRGIRSLYFSRCDDHLLISTRSDWLARLTGSYSVHFGRFGSHWRLANQLSTSSLLEGISRLGPGERLHVGREMHKEQNGPWAPEDSHEELSTLSDALCRGTRISHEGDGGISLGLSGGLDSRALLAAGPTHSRFATHTFGPESTADVQVAQSIAARNRNCHRSLWDALPPVDDCIELVKDHMATKMAVTPASSTVKMRLYDRLQEYGVLVVDGGFGEICRRGYHRRLLLQNPRALPNGHVATVKSHLRTSRADIFTETVNARMEEGVVEDLTETLDALPENGEANTLADLLSVRTRLPNFFGRAQTHLDQLVPNLMPFALPSVLTSTFAAPVIERKRGRAVRELIRRRAPSLAEIPLARGSVTVPFWMAAEVGHVWAKMKEAIGLTFEDPIREVFLNRVAPWARDSVRSQSVREYSPYAYAKIRALVDGYYQGRHERSAEVDWWIAFECWRQTLRR